MNNDAEILILDDNQDDLAAFSHILQRELMASQKLTSIAALSGEIAHKMNNLIGAVIGYASMLQIDISSDDPTYKYIEAIMEASQGIADLAKNLMSYTRAGRSEVSGVNINDLLGKMVRIYRNGYKDKISIGLQLSKEPMEVNCNENMLMLALANIFINAQESTPDDGFVNIAVSKGQLPKDYNFGRPESTNLDYAVISIFYNGPGMDGDVISKIFGTIFSVDQNLNNQISLSSACCIIQRFKGAIRVNTHHDEGSEFSIYLPLI